MSVCDAHMLQRGMPDPRPPRKAHPPAMGRCVNPSGQDLLLIAIAFAAAVVNAFFLRTALRDGNRTLALSAAVASLVFALVGLVFFARAF